MKRSFKGESLTREMLIARQLTKDNFSGVVVSLSCGKVGEYAAILNMLGSTNKKILHQVNLLLKNIRSISSELSVETLLVTQADKLCLSVGPY